MKRRSGSSVLERPVPSENPRSKNALWFGFPLTASRISPQSRITSSFDLFGMFHPQAFRHAVPVTINRWVRNALVAVLIGLHAAVTLCGPGLHAISGLSHGNGYSPFARNDHSHGPGPSSHQASDDCLVCQFLAQGQLASDFGIGVSPRVPLDEATTLAPRIDPSVSLRLFVPRGPPLGFSPAQIS